MMHVIKKPLPSETAAFTFISHLRLLSSSHSEMWNRLPVYREFNFQIPSRHQTNQPKSKPAGSEAAREMRGSRARGGEPALRGARLPSRGLDDLGTTEPWPLRGPGIRAALKWLPEEGCSKPRTGCPQAALPPGSVRLPAAARRGQGAPHLGHLPRPRRGRSRLHLTLRKVSPAPPASARHVRLGIAMATSFSAPSLLVEQLRRRASLNLLLRKLKQPSEGLVS